MFAAEINGISSAGLAHPRPIPDIRSMCRGCVVPWLSGTVWPWFWGSLSLLPAGAGAGYRAGLSNKPRDLGWVPFPCSSWSPGWQGERFPLNSFYLPLQVSAPWEEHVPFVPKLCPRSLSLPIKTTPCTFTLLHRTFKWLSWTKTHRQTQCAPKTWWYNSTWWL